MKDIDSQTRRKMVQAFTILFVALSYPTFRVMLMHRSLVPSALYVLIVLPSLFALLPLAVMKSQQRLQNRLRERAQWLEAYKASPESHLLHLND
jgi:hypothetical protein